MSNENTAIKLHFSSSPSKTEIFSYSDDIKIRLNALPNELTLRGADAQESYYVQLSRYLNDKFERPNKSDKDAYKEWEHKWEIMNEIMSNSEKDIDNRFKEISAEIDKVCKTFETYIKGKALEVAKEKQRLIDEAKKKFDEQFSE